MKECPGCIVRLPLEVSQSSVFYIFGRFGPEKSGPQRRLLVVPLAGSGVILSRRSRPRQLVPVTRLSLFCPILSGCGLSAVPDAAAAGSRRIADRIRGEAGGEKDGDQRRRPNGKAATTFQKFAAILLAVCPEFFGFLNGIIEIPVRSAITPGIHQARNDRCSTSACCMFFLRKKTCSQGYWHPPLRLDI